MKAHLCITLVLLFGWIHPTLAAVLDWDFDEPGSGLPAGWVNGDGLDEIGFPELGNGGWDTSGNGLVAPDAPSSCPSSGNCFNKWVDTPEFQVSNAAQDLSYEFQVEIDLNQSRNTDNDGILVMLLRSDNTLINTFFQHLGFQDGDIDPAVTILAETPAAALQANTNYKLRFRVHDYDQESSLRTVMFDDLSISNANLVGAPCDFDGSGSCDVADLDDLYAEGDLVAGVLGGDLKFDLSGDDVVDTGDLDQWLDEAAVENGQVTPYLLGDTELDRDIDIFDVLNINSGAGGGSAFGLAGTNPGWGGGDVDGNGMLDIFDVLKINQSISAIGGFGSGYATPSDSLAPVPEPSALALLTATTAACLVTRRRRW